MAHFIRRRCLSRRTFLRGVGATIGLPLLDAMRPAFTRAEKFSPPRRTIFIFAPNGKKMDEWRLEGPSAPLSSLPPLLKPLEGHQQSLTLFRGLTLDGGRANGDGAGDHARAAASFLTCRQPRKTGGSDLSAGVSVDQVLARHLGRETRFPSLELGLEGGQPAGVCDSGYSCAYSNNISWNSPETPVAKEVRPKQVFARLFGDPTDLLEGEARAARLRRRRSVLDFVLDDARRLRGSLGSQDRAKLDQYLTGVREVEKRLAQDAKGPPSEISVPKALRTRTGHDHATRLHLMQDLVVLALQSDLTRVVTLMLGNAGSNRSYRFLGVREGHHTLSHHGGKAENLAGIRKINLWHVEQLARFLSVLAAAEEGASNLLAETTVVYGSGLADGDAHAHHDLPVLMAGGRLRGGRHVVSPNETPLANLYLSILRDQGVEATAFGDSTGPLKGL